MLRRWVRPRPLPALVCTLAFVAVTTTATLAAPAAAAPADDLAAKRAEAARLQAAISENGMRISVLDEEFNETRLAIEAATVGITDAEARMDAAADRSREIRTRVASRAAQIYMQRGSAGALPLLEVDDLQEAAARAVYTDAAADDDRALVDDLTVATEELDLRQAELEAARADAAERQDALAQTREQIDDAQREQQELLDGVNGDIADLVAEIEAQRRAEEEAAARAEAQRRAEDARRAQAARDAEARRAATTTVARGADDDDQGRTDDPDPQPPPSSAPAPNANAQTAVDTAMAQLGKPYRYAASGPDSFDCSGLTSYAWGAAGVGLPHSSRAQYGALPKVSQDALAPGDLVFYGSPIHHVGIYIGGGQYVHAPQTGDVVKVSTIYRRDWAGAARPG